MVAKIAGLLALLAGLALMQAMGSGAVTAGIRIDDAWARPTIGTSSQGVIYLTITNRGSAADRLISVTTPAAASAELHSMKTEGGMMKMRALDVLEIPAGQSVQLAPGGDHIMLLGVAKPLRAGDTLKLTLGFETAGDLSVDVPVKAGAPEPMAH